MKPNTRKNKKVRKWESEVQNKKLELNEEGYVCKSCDSTSNMKRAINIKHIPQA